MSVYGLECILKKISVSVKLKYSPKYPDIQKSFDVLYL